MRFVAIIPMRGGSKSIPNKNIKKFGGKPLCYWVLEAAMKSKLIDEIYVSSDSQKILNIVKKLSKKINLISRSPELAKDDTSTEDVLLDFCKKVDFKNLLTIQATSPFTTHIHLDTAIKKFNNQKLDSLFTAVRSKRFYWSDSLKPINYIPKARSMRQDFKGTLMENGSFYITNRKTLLKEKCRLGGKIGVFEMDENHAIEIDEIEDWNLLKKRIKNN